MELSSGVGIRDVFANPIDRRRTIIAVCGLTSQAASGSMFVIGTCTHRTEIGLFTDRLIAYKAYFFTMAHVSNPFAMSCVLSTVGLAALIINSLIVIHWGRRRVILTSGLLTCGVLQLIIAVVYNQKPGTPQTGKIIVGITSLYMFSYNVSLLPTPRPRCGNC
jgi:hypothetical protein